MVSEIYLKQWRIEERTFVSEDLSESHENIAGTKFRVGMVKFHLAPQPTCSNKTMKNSQ